jgi:hypothetical protein
LISIDRQTTWSCPSLLLPLAFQHMLAVQTSHQLEYSSTLFTKVTIHWKECTFTIWASFFWIITKLALADFLPLQQRILLTQRKVILCLCFSWFSERKMLSWNIYFQLEVIKNPFVLLYYWTNRTWSFIADKDRWVKLQAH